MICGAYGRGNAGDDAILEAILQEMRSIDPDMPITGPHARTPGAPGSPTGCGAVAPFQLPGLAPRPCGKQPPVHQRRRQPDPGRDLPPLPVVLSRQYPAAKRCGNKVQMYGCGIGPVTRESHRTSGRAESSTAMWMSSPSGSRTLWRSCGPWVSTEPEILLTADPALTLQQGPG